MMEQLETIHSNETLYRVVKRSKPDYIQGYTRKISPALFKDPNGISVDRDCGRSEDEVIHFIIYGTFRKRSKAVVSIAARVCYDIGARVEAAPTENNPYHANIFLSETEHQRNLQALQMADSCDIVYYDEEMNWSV